MSWISISLICLVIIDIVRMIQNGIQLDRENKLREEANQKWHDMEQELHNQIDETISRELLKIFVDKGGK